MSVMLRLVVFLGALSNGVLYASDEAAFPPKCTDPECDRTAQAVEWPKPLSGKTIEVQVGRFVINVPARPVDKMGSYASDVTFRYEGGGGYSLGVVSKKQFPMLEGTQYTLYDLIDITFTKTSKDPEPTASKDLLVWRSALTINKSLFFKDAVVYVAEKGDLKLFYTKRDAAMPRNSSSPVVVLDRADKHSHLTIGVTGVDFETFISSVATVRRK